MRRARFFVLGVLVGAVGAIAVFYYLTANDNMRVAPIAPPPAAPVASPRAISPAPPAPAVPPAPVQAAPAPADTVTASSALSGLLLPVRGVQPSELVDTFNQTRGGTRIHEALDIMAPRGREVLAINDGKIVKLFTSKQGGLTVYQFDPSERYAYYYAHLDRYAPGIAEGKVLKRGELIGYVGSTGNANPDAPHLHFAIFELGPEKRWWEGKPINPYPLLNGLAEPGE